MQLIAAGVLTEHIQIAGISTLSNPRDFFYRREKVSAVTVHLSPYYK